MSKNCFGLPNLYPITNRIEAKTAFGIKFKNIGIEITLTNNKTPCVIVESFVSPPLIAFADERTITCVTGKPPIKPAKEFPTPCAINSRFVGV